MKSPPEHRRARETGTGTPGEERGDDVLNEELATSNEELLQNFNERVKAEKALEVANEVLEQRVADIGPHNWNRP